MHHALGCDVALNRVEVTGPTELQAVAPCDGILSAGCYFAAAGRAAARSRLAG